MESKYNDMNTDNWEIVTVSDEDILGGDGVNFTMPGNGSTSQEIPNQQAPPQQSNIPGSQPGKKTLNIGKEIPANLAIGAFDKLMSSSVILIASFFDVEITKKEICLNAEEKKFLEPPVQDYLDTLNITLSPGEQMVAALAAVYVGKGVEIYEGQGKEPKARKTTTNNIDLNEVAKGTGKKRGAYKPRQPKD